MENHEERTQSHIDGQLPRERLLASASHILSCERCRRLVNSWSLARNHFSDLRSAALPPFFESRLNARLRNLPEAGFNLRAPLAPALAFTALTLAVWGALSALELDCWHPVDELILGGEGRITTAAVSAEQPDEPVKFLALSEEETL